MILRRLFPIAVALLLLAPAGSGIARAAQEEPPHGQRPSRTLPGDIVVVADSWEQDEAGNRLLVEGSVSLSSKDTRIQADRISIVDQRYVEANGHVLLVWYGTRVAGTRLTYDLEEDRGVVEDAIGQMEQEYYFWADRAEKIGDDKLHLDSATVTTCNQPLAYWSFSVTSANIRVRRYARMWNVRLKTGKVPVFYLPYLVWPVKPSRAAGLLLPEIHTTRNRGRVINQELFIPIGRSADITLLGRYYTEAGFGGGGEARFIPNPGGRAKINGFFIRDKVANFQNRYRAAYQQTQRFRNGFRMVSDVNLVSDFNYFSDFERDLDLVSSPTILARLEFSRNARWTSLNVRELRRKQLFSGGSELVQKTLPELEWRGRSRRLGKSPFYLSFESSAAAIQQEGTQQNFPINADYLRADFFPQISAPISRIPWLDVNPSVSYRVTHYTQYQRLRTNASGLPTGRDTIDESLTRALFGAGLEIVGPKIVKIYETPENRYSPRFKHTLEPNLSYGFREDYDRIEDVFVFDEVDSFNGAGAQISYGIRSRLIAKRPRAAAPLPSGDGETILFPGELASTAPPDPLEAPVPDAADVPREPVEIATFEVRQSRSFERDLSFADLDGDGVREESSPFSRIQMIGRLNPSRAASIDLRGNYDTLHNQISDVTLSGIVNGSNARARFSAIHREGLGVDFLGQPNPDDTQLRLTTGLRVFRDKIRIDLDGSIDFNPQPGQARIPDKRWRLTYVTQCCTFLVEKLSRDFSALEDRRDIHLRIDLRGFGKLFDTSF